MKLSELKSHLQTIKTISFKLPNGNKVPSHFHITEVGKTSKHYIDCGGTVRKEDTINLQLWSANDYDHKLEPKKFLDIINLSEQTIGLGNFNIEVAYQGETINIFNLDFNGTDFLLKSTTTGCLAEDACGITPTKQKKQISELTSKNSCCDLNSGCC